jgi:IrrE N-terminal-like domain
MRYVADRTGRFSERPHYKPQELDVIFERIVVEFLRGRHGDARFPITTEELTVLIENDVDDLDPYADLSGYGNEVEGVTEFVPGRLPRVRIAGELAGNENRENRYRTTLTHEFGHVRLHGYLFEVARASGSFFDSSSKANVIVCKRETIITAPQTDWMEWQAGYACGAILMPARYARASVAAYRERAGLSGPVPAATKHGQAMIDGIVEAFQVSRDAARVRLSVLGILGVPVGERTLFS